LENNAEKLLLDLLNEVQLLTVSTKVSALKKFQDEFLTSDMRKQAYAAFDGERTLQEISNAIDCKLNTLQIFAQLLVEKDLVDATTVGRARILSKSTAKIAIYYASKTLESSGE